MGEEKKTSGSNQHLGTLFGILAILFWSSSIAFTKSLADQLGVLTSSAIIYLASGLLGCLYMIATGRLGAVLRLPKAYLFGGGALFVAYLTLFCLAVGLSENGQQVVEVGLINYLWPALVVVLAIPIQRYRARWLLVPGILVALIGVFLASLGNRPLGWEVLVNSLASFGGHLGDNALPFVLSLGNALAWALYSNLTTRLCRTKGIAAVPLFLLAGGLLLAAIRSFWPENSHLDRWGPLELAYMILGPALLAYLCWDAALRRGQMILVASLSYFIPLLSTWITCWAQGLPMGLNLWLACLLIVSGAWLCKAAIRETPSP